MSSKVDQREIAKRQRRHLKKHGFPEYDIEVFARIFTATDPDTTDLPPCEQDT